MSDPATPWLIAIDSSTDSPGFCTMRLDGTVIRVWSLKPRCTGMERCCLIEDVLAASAEGACMAFVENYSFGSAYNRERLAEMVGILKRRLYKMGIPVRLIPPAQHKKFNTGCGKAPDGRTGKAAKLWYKEQIEQVTGLTFADSDQADAVSIAAMGAAVLRVLADPALLLKMPRHQQEVILKHCEDELLTAPSLLADPQVNKLIQRLQRAHERKHQRRCAAGAPEPAAPKVVRHQSAPQATAADAPAPPARPRRRKAAV